MIGWRAFSSSLHVIVVRGKLEDEPKTSAADSLTRDI